MSETYWAIKRREWASREQRATRRTRRSVPLRGPRPPSVAPPIPEPVTVDEETTEIVETTVESFEPSYRDLQAQAKEHDIKANQSADDLKKALGQTE